MHQELDIFIYTVQTSKRVNNIFTFIFHVRH